MGRSAEGTEPCARRIGSTSFRQKTFDRPTFHLHDVWSTYQRSRHLIDECVLPYLRRPDVGRRKARHLIDEGVLHCLRRPDACRRNGFRSNGVGPSSFTWSFSF